MHSQCTDPRQPHDASTMQRHHQARRGPAAKGRGSPTAQKPIPTGRLGGGVPGGLPWQDPTTVPRNHQAQPGAVLAFCISTSHSLAVCLSYFSNTALPTVLISQPITTSYCVWKRQTELSRSNCTLERKVSELLVQSTTAAGAARVVSG